MSSTFGNKLKISLFGESHGPAVGIVMDGLPSGFVINLDELQEFMDRRSPGKSNTSQRKEGDRPEILSGVYNGYTCGTPLAIVIRNEDVRSEDYENLRSTPRPGHADYTNHIKHGGFEDYRGGGHSSGRITAALTAGGGIAKQVLEDHWISVIAELIEVGGRQDGFDEVIKAAALDGDSVGGVVECRIKGMPPGFGDPHFDGVENRIAQAVFAIPGVKGIEFGDGFKLAAMRGSESNDSFDFDEDGNVATLTNHQGGILGGITNGMEIVFRVAFKPTPSISKPQQSIDYYSHQEKELVVEGRHDPCIALRAIPVVEAVTAIAVLDMVLQDGAI